MVTKKHFFLNKNKRFTVSMQNYSFFVELQFLFRITVSIQNYIFLWQFSLDEHQFLNGGKMESPRGAKHRF